VSWEEIEAAAGTGLIDALRIAPEEALRRLEDLGDPWEAIPPQEPPPT
jgi:hypothetical protein